MPAPPPVRVLVVNDFAVVAAGVLAMLQPFHQRVRVVATRFSDLDELPETDLVLYDNFAALPAVESAVLAAVRDSRAKLVIYSWAEHPHLVEQALDDGACGYLSKRLEAAQLVSALEVIQAGEIVTPGGTRGRLGEPGRDGGGQWPGVDHNLSGRESEVIALIAAGLTNQQIAERCYLSVNSVKTYARTAYKKMGVTSRSQAVLWALAHGFSRHADPE